MRPTTRPITRVRASPRPTVRARATARPTARVRPSVSPTTRLTVSPTTGLTVSTVTTPANRPITRTVTGAVLDEEETMAIEPPVMYLKHKRRKRRQQYDWVGECFVPGVCLTTFAVVVITCVVLVAYFSRQGPFSATLPTPLPYDPLPCFGPSLFYSEQHAFQTTNDIFPLMDYDRVPAKILFRIDVSAAMPTSVSEADSSKVNNSFLAISLPIPANLTLILVTDNCTTRFGLIKELFKGFPSIEEFRRELPGFAKGLLSVGSFRCVRDEITIRQKKIEVSGFRFRLDINFQAETVTISTCDYKGDLDSCTEKLQEKIKLSYYGLSNFVITYQALWNGKANVDKEFNLRDYTDVTSRCVRYR